MKKKLLLTVFVLTAFAQLFAHSAVPPYIIKPIETPTSTYCVGNTLIKPTVHFTKIADGWRYSTSGIGGYTDFADTTKLQTTHNHRFIYYYAVTASNDTNYSDTVRLTVKPNVTEETSLEHCGTYIWGTQAYSSTGTYHATFTADNGCDSNVTLHLTINDTPHTNFSETACHSYIWNTVTYSQSGTYSQILKTSANCDSVVTLNLTINQSTTEDTFATACDKFTWHGNTYTQSGIYTITTTNTVRCDSTIILHLTINHSSESIDIQNVCDSLTWRNGLTYYANNTTDTVMLRNSNAQGCDSTITLNLVLRHSSSATDPHTACDQFTWINGLTYTADNTTDTYTTHNAQGCDSIVTINLTINHSATSDTFATVCDQFTWHGNTYTQSGIYTFATYTIAGCDSIINLHLTINHSSESIDIQNVCDSLTWRNGLTYYTNNTTDTVMLRNSNAEGCDSTIALNLVVRHSTSATDPHTACDQFTWINGQTYTADNTTDTYTLHNAQGCDSVVTLNLTINHSATSDTFATACDQFTWHGNTYTQSGIYTFATYTIAGCDSIINLHLTINNSSESIDIQNVCDSLTWRNGLTYYANNTTDTVMLRGSNAEGCDSTITLNLVVRHSTSATDPHTACDQYTWINGQTYTADNTTDTYTLPNAQGCDSVVTLNLTINQSTTTDTFATACDQFTWHGSTYTENTNAPIYHDLTTHGCDSTVNLHLTIKKAQKADTSATACNSFIWRGRIFYASTIVSDTTHRTYADGCDSIVTLHLTVNQSSPITYDNFTACDSFTWINGQTYTTSTITAHTLHNIYGCDSTIRLNLVIHLSDERIDSQTACDSYSWHGNKYNETTSSPYPTYKTTDQYGCTVTTYLQLTIIHSPQAPTIAGPNDICLGQKATYTIENSNNNYTYKWYLDGFELDFDPTSEPITFDKQYEQVSAIASENNRSLTCWSDTSRLAIKVNTIQAPEVKDLIVKKGNGTPIIIYPTSQSDKYHYTWYKNNTEITNIPDQPYYVTQPNKDKQGDNFYVNISLPTQSQCQNNSNTIKLNITPKQADQALAISPNPSNGNFTVTLLDTNDQASTIQIYNNSGVVVAHKATNSNHNAFNLTLPQGNYLVQVTTRSGNIYTQKLIIK